MDERQELQHDWRRDLRTKILWALLAKVLGLALLWWLFFRGTHS